VGHDKTRRYRLRFVSRQVAICECRRELYAGGIGTWIAREGRFGQTCDWPVMRFGYKPVGRHMFSWPIKAQLVNSWRTLSRRFPVTWIVRGRPCPPENTDFSWWPSAAPFAAMPPSRIALNWSENLTSSPIVRQALPGSDKSMPAWTSKKSFVNSAKEMPPFSLLEQPNTSGKKLRSCLESRSPQFVTASGERSRESDAQPDQRDRQFDAAIVRCDSER